jgi:hypothetical protein
MMQKDHDKASPLGSTKVPRSLPDVIARLSWLAVEGLSSTLYFDSTNCDGGVRLGETWGTREHGMLRRTFLIVGRETPPRASSG